MNWENSVVALTLIFGYLLDLATVTRVRAKSLAPESPEALGPS